MRKFVIPEQHLAIIIQSAADAALSEGKSFTSRELSLALKYIEGMPGVMVITSEKKGDSHGN